MSKNSDSDPLRHRYAVVGTGSRARMYLDAIERRFNRWNRVVALCDNNPGRLAYAQSLFEAHGLPAPPAYRPDAFDRMLRDNGVQTVIVASVDRTHDDYIVRAMDLGCDVITEKPMTTDAPRCRRILEAQRRSGRQCTVTFNYRYAPARTQVKELLMDGVIGDVLSGEFKWLLNTIHGADYFRRWHSRKANSGGLLVHKATHHFDLCHWWLSAVPLSVRASGRRGFYTPETARRMGLRSHHQRCHGCPEADRCGFFLDLSADPTLKSLYLDAEAFDGYHRDLCVWRPDIDIEDTMHALVTYENGVLLSYSLDAFNAWEGYNIAFNGTAGRLEHTMEEQVYVSGASTLQGALKEGGARTRIIPLRGPPREVDVPPAGADHAGADPVMLADLFDPELPPDRFLRKADQRSGAWSILTGIAGNESIRSGLPVRIADLVPDLEYPDYPQMPNPAPPLPMPPLGGL